MRDYGTHIEDRGTRFVRIAPLGPESWPTECCKCGAYVLNVATHAEWHAGTPKHEPPERATPHRLTGEHIVRERFGDERVNGPHFDFGGPTGDYHQMVDE